MRNDGMFPIQKKEKSFIKNPNMIEMNNKVGERHVILPGTEVKRKK
jgi:hypothetical protein